MNNSAHIGQNELKKIKRLLVSNRLEQFTSSMSFIMINDVFKPVDQLNNITRASLLKLNQPLRNNNHGQKSISYIAPLMWNNLQNSLKQERTLTLTKRTTREINVYIFFCVIAVIAPYGEVIYAVSVLTNLYLYTL